MKFTTLVFGCQMNYSDTAKIKAIMRTCWFVYTESIEESDIVIFDTCSVKQKSEDKITGKLKEIPKNKKIRITGCMIQHNFRNASINNKLSNKKINWLMKKWNFQWTITTEKPEIIWLNNQEIKNLSKTHNKYIKKENITQKLLFVNNAFNPFFYNLKKTYNNLELVFRIDDVGFLPTIIKKLWYKISWNIKITNEYAQIIPNFISDNTWSLTAYIPISTWCNQFCSFCIVPYARGLEKHHPVSQIIKEVKTNLQNWAKEIYLLGQIVNKHPKFTEIIKKVLKLDWLERLRYTSPYPTHYNDELFQLHQNETKLCPHIHIPVQSGSNKILKKMFRGYTVEEFKKFIDKIRKLDRQISITTDIIVWFPDETEEDFQQSLELVEYSQFDMIYIWIYSPRPGTYANQKLQDTIPYEIKHKRRNILNNLLTKISIKNNKSEIWKTKKILIKSKNSEWFEWYTDNQKAILIKTNKNKTKQDKKNKEIKTNSFQNIKITESKGFKLYWE